MSQPQAVQDVFAGHTNKELFRALCTVHKRLEDSPGDQSARTTRGWLITELETRLPKAHAHIERLYSQAEQQLVASGGITEIDHIAELRKFI